MIIKMILTNGFDPDPRVYKEAKTLVDRGFDVEIIAWDRESKFTNSSSETMNDIKIRRIQVDGKYGSGAKQLFGYIVFIRNVMKYLVDKNYDVVHCHDFDGLLAGYFVKLFQKKGKLYYDQHDLFHLYFENRNGVLNKVISKVIKMVETYVLRRVKYHIVVTPNMQKLYKEISDPVIITNAPLRSTITNIEKKKREHIVIGFIGSVRYYNELITLIDAAYNYKNIQVFIAGGGIALDSIKEYVAKNKYNHVIFYGKFEVNELETLYSNIDLTYLIYPKKDSKISLPNKFFESIITETPIISDLDSEYGMIIKDLRIGWAIQSTQLSNSLDQIFSEISGNQNNVLDIYKSNMHKVKEKFYWEENIKVLCDIYTS